MRRRGTMAIVTVFLELCLFLIAFQLDNSEAAVAVYSTKLYENAKYFCPKYSFVSNFIIKKGPRQGEGFKDYSFYFECDLFTPPDFDDDAKEKCVVRFKWQMGGYDLRMDDHFKSCSCDQYLAGIKTNYTDGQRIVQFRCCHAKNKIHNITGCYFTGQRPLYAEWDTQIKAKKGKEVVEGVQTFAIIDNYVIGRVCPYFVKEKDISEIKYKVNKCSGVKKRGIKAMIDKIKQMAKECKIYMGSPFGWPMTTNSMSNNDNMVNKHGDDRLYQQQKTMCRDGDYLYALYKFPKMGAQGKDYIFLTRCHVLVYTVCHCMWKQNCTKPDKRNESEGNKTMYVAGFRSKWDEENSRRKFELWCCKTSGLKQSSCNLTKNYTDGDTTLVIARPRYKFMAFHDPKCIDGQIIRDVDHWYIKGVLQMRFNICNINGSDGECEKPCKTCKDIDGTGEICRGRGVVDPFLQSTTTPPRSPTPTTTACTGLTGPCTTSEAPVTFGSPPACKMDVNFVLDSTGSLTQEGFNEEKQFIRTFVGKINVGPNEEHSRVAMTMFASTAHQMWDFKNTQQTTSNIQSKVDALPYWGGSTNITGGLQTAIGVIDSQSRHTSSTMCVPRVVILITDGRHNVGTMRPTVPAQQLRGMGASLYAIGIGPDANYKELVSITGDPTHTHMVDSGNLHTIIDQIVKQACAQKSQTCTNAPPPPPAPPAEPPAPTDGKGDDKK